MQMQATRAFHTTLPDKINLSIIIVIIVMQPVSLCRRTPFMISSLHVTKVIMLIMIMTTRRDCGSHSRRSSACDSANHAILGSENV